MKLDEKIAYEEKKSEVRPKSCKGCRHVFTEKGEYKNHFCKLIRGSYEEECINYCVANDIVAYNCPLLTEDKAKNHRQLVEWLKELKVLRKAVRDALDMIQLMKESDQKLYVCDRKACLGGNCPNAYCFFTSDPEHDISKGGDSE